MNFELSMTIIKAPMTPGDAIVYGQKIVRRRLALILLLKQNRKNTSKLKKN